MVRSLLQVVVPIKSAKIPLNPFLTHFNNLLFLMHCFYEDWKPLFTNLHSNFFAGQKEKSKYHSRILIVDYGKCIRITNSQLHKQLMNEWWEFLSFFSDFYEFFHFLATCEGQDDMKVLVCSSSNPFKVKWVVVLHDFLKSNNEHCCCKISLFSRVSTT